MSKTMTFEEHVENCFYDEAEKKLNDWGIIDHKEKIALAHMRLLEDTECQTCSKAWGLWEEMGLDYLHALAITEQWKEFHKWQKPLYREYKRRFSDG